METQQQAQMIYPSSECPLFVSIRTPLVAVCLVSGSNCWLLCSLFRPDKGTSPPPSSPPPVAVCRRNLTHSNSSALINSVLNSHFHYECVLLTVVCSQKVAPLWPGLLENPPHQETGVPWGVLHRTLCQGRSRAGSLLTRRLLVFSQLVLHLDLLGI